MGTHFMEEEVEAQRGKAACPGSQQLLSDGARTELGCLVPESTLPLKHPHPGHKQGRAGPGGWGGRLRPLRSSGSHPDTWREGRLSVAPPHGSPEPAVGKVAAPVCVGTCALWHL